METENYLASIITLLESILSEQQDINRKLDSIQNDISYLCDGDDNSVPSLQGKLESIDKTLSDMSFDTCSQLSDIERYLDKINDAVVDISL